uniref:Protein kinase domain-containing protein n=1 Tax=Oryza nivara TaxID=4536 RepID=A0A0E0J5A5_ORYNI
MALWNGLGQVANIAQLAGVDAYGLIKMIVEAAQTAKRNQETCQKLARHVKMIGDLLQRLQSTELMQHQETRNPVEQLEETLRHTYMLILSCQDSSYLHSCFMGGKQAHQLREVQSDITFYLQLFPLVSFVNTTRTWERLLRRAQPSCTEDTADELQKVHHSDHRIRFNTEILNATEFGDQSVTQCPEVFEEKRSEQASIRSLNLDQLVVNDIGKGAVLTFSQILAATNNFSGRSLIGQGGFGPVYKGKLPNGLEIAVKRHDTSSHQGEEEFMAEIDVIPKLRRKNIIELIGFCVQGKECILVYEYIPNGNETKRILLNWSKRLKIIEGISDGLLYLHNHSPKCIVHRDIKASNILLDYEMNAKISDFGLAIKLAPKATTEVLVRGTWGYADPEYVATGVISEKTDVYSFGIVLLEIISGKLCVSGYNVKSRSRRTIFPEFALKNRKKLHKLIDPSLGAKKHERAQIMQCLRVAMLCVRDRAEHRPTMSEVVTMLPSIKTPKDRKSLIQGRRPLAIPPATASAASHRRHRLLPASPLLCLHRLLPLHKPRSPSTHPTRRSRPSCLVEVEARGIDSAPVLRLSPQATDLETVRSASRRRLQFRLGSMRRRPGIAGLQNAAATRDQFRLVGENVAKVRTDVMKEQLATFRTQLEEFALKHKNDIRKNPLFRQQFHEMCAKVGVDPLASNKGAWAELLGIGDFYYELGVQIVDICIATRATNGGLIDLLDLRKLLCQKRKADLGSLTSDDCLRAISKLKAIISVGKKKLVRSVPTELNKDHNGILELAQAEGFVTVEQVKRKFSWSTGRAIDVLETLLKEGLAMIDDGHRDGKRRYWFPCATLSSDSIGADAKGEAPAPPLTASGDSSSPTPAAAADSSSPSLDLIPDIARRLTSLEHFFSLRASYLPASRRLLASQSPLLLVSLYPSFAEAFFHPRLRRLHRFRLPWGHHLPPSRYTLLYAHGFLVTATHRRQQLPAKAPPPPPLHRRAAPPPQGLRALLPRHPHGGPPRRHLLGRPGRATVQHCHPGDALWRVASAPAPHVFDDLISVNGTLYALVGLRLATLKLSESSLELPFLGKERKWEMITNLGGRSLFLGLDGFAACVDEDHPGVGEDCLYAAGRRLGEWHEYSLADGTCDVCNADYPGSPPLNKQFTDQTISLDLPQLVRWGRGGVGLGAVEEVGAEALGGKVAPRVEDAPRSTRCCSAASSETKTTASPSSSGSSAMTASAYTLEIREPEMITTYMAI